MDMSKTLLRIRGFGDVNFHGSNRNGNTNSFGVGQLNLFVTSDISEKFKFLGEIVFESGPDNFYNVPGGRRNDSSTPCSPPPSKAASLLGDRGGVSLAAESITGCQWPGPE